MVARSTLVFCLCASMALAAPTKHKSLAAELSGAALTSYEQGRALFEHADFATAHAKFRQAFDASKNPRLLWNMAACSAKQKRYALALAEVDRYLSLGVGVISADQARNAEAFRTEVSGFVAHATVRVTPADAVISIDREAGAIVDGSKIIVLDVGVHEIDVERRGFEPLRDTFTIREVGNVTLTYALRPVEQPTATPSVTALPPILPSPEVAAQPPMPIALSTSLPGANAVPQDKRWSGRDIVGWSLLGAGAVAIAGGAAEHLASRAAARDFNSKCEGNVCDPSASTDFDDANAAAVVATSLYIGGLVFAGTGMVLLWTGTSGSSTALRVSATPGGVSLGGAF